MINEEPRLRHLAGIRATDCFNKRRVVTRFWYGTTTLEADKITEERG